MNAERKIKVSSKEKMQTVAEITATNDRTITLVYATETPVLRSSPYEGNYYEVLSIDSAAMDMKRVIAGAPLLDSHRNESVNDILGSIESTYIKDKKAYAVVRISSQHEDVLQKIREGTIKNVSVGYRVRKLKDISNKGDNIPTYLAIDYQVLEISLVGVPADPNSTIISRKSEEETTEAILVSKENNRMSENQNNQSNQTLAERQRVKEITASVRAAKLDDTFAEELIDSGVTADQARKQVIEKLAAQPKPQISSGVSTPEVGDDLHAMRKQRFEEAVLHRIDPANFKVTEGSRELFGRSLIQMAQSFVPRYSMESDVAYVKRSMSSSDLPLALANLAEKALQNSYELAPKSHKAWTKNSTVRNYKQASFVALSDYPSLVERPEGAEFEYGSLGEKNEVVQIKDYGKILKFSSQMVVNDDLNALQNLALGGGKACSRLDNRLAYLALKTNKTMGDAVALYHATHNNLGTAGAISETSINEAVKAMMKQTSVDELDNLNLVPKYLICGPDQMINAKKQLAIIQATQTGDVNPFSGSMELVVDSELTGNQYYFAADQNVIDTVTMFRLEGQEQPKISSQINWKDNALELKVDYAVDAQPMDWRGLYKNAGQ